MRVAYLDCFAGIAGDMLLGALVDAGVPRSVLEGAADAMNLGASLQFESVDRSGITSVKVRVLDRGQPAEAPAPSRPEEQQKSKPFSPQVRTQHQHRDGHHGFTSASGANTWDEVAINGEAGRDEDHARSLTDIREIIVGSRLAAEVEQLAMRAFDLLGASEAKIHNVPADEIHFHEVGAVDAIVDIVASAAGLVHLRADAWHCSPVNVGSGTVRCAHGVFPVPAPATADLLRGVPTYAAHLQKELTTPTGAALLRALSPTYGPQPAMQVESIGYGAGTRNPPGFPNVLRLCVGEASAARGATPNELPESALGAASQESAKDSVAVIETAVDDATPQLLAYVADCALDTGALDVMLTPVIMKKGRPGTLLTVLARPEDARRLEQLLLRETTTLGVRTRMDRRVCLDREHVEVQTEFGTVRVKIGRSMGETLNANPEFEDCRRLAEQNGLPLKHVHASAMAAYLNAHSTKGPKS